MCSQRERFQIRNVNAIIHPALHHTNNENQIQHRSFVTDVIIGFMIILIFHLWIVYLMYSLYKH